MRFHFNLLVVPLLVLSSSGVAETSHCGFGTACSPPKSSDAHAADHSLQRKSDADGGGRPAMFTSMQDGPPKAEISGEGELFDENAIAKDQKEVDLKRRRQVRIDANQARIHRLIQDQFEKKRDALKAWLDCYDLIQRDRLAGKPDPETGKAPEPGHEVEKGSNGCEAKRSTFSTVATALLGDKSFVWSAGNKGLIQRAIRADTWGFFTADILRSIPQTEMTPGMVEAFIFFLTKKDHGVEDYVERTQVAILQAINNPNGGWGARQITLDPAAGEQAWGPIISLLAAPRYNLVSEANRTLKRSKFDTSAVPIEDKP